MDNKADTMTVGNRGQVLLQDIVLLDEMAHFDRERIPERVVHAKGAGEHPISLGLSDSENMTETVVLVITNSIVIVVLCWFVFINAMIKSKGAQICRVF